MKYILFLFLILNILTATAQEYSILNINKKLQENANLIVRNEQTIFELSSEKSGTKKYKIAYTILNKSADEYSYLEIFYDNFIHITNIHVNVYNKDGIKMSVFNESNFQDQSIITDGTFFNKERKKSLKISELNYPFTIEFSYNENYNGFLTYPSFYPITDFNCSIEKSEYKITYPSTMNVRFDVHNVLQKNIKTDGDKTLTSFAVENIYPISYESLTVGLKDITPWVKVAPSKFEFDGSKGNLETWESLGNWIYQLSDGLDILPDDIKTKIHSMCDSLDNDIDKIKLLYNFMQSDTRYISVQLGIGGFKPFPAEKVYRNKYGDCKALSNYMKALLKEVNIKSYLTILAAGARSSLIPNFASIGQANHMILCVPQQKDTIWLECTSQKNPFNYLGSFTGNRIAMIATESGGKLCNTKSYSSKDNLQNRKGDVYINADGSSTANFVTIYSNVQFENIQEEYFLESKDQKKNLYERLNIPNCSIKSFSYDQKDKNIPIIEQNLSIEIPKLLTSVGNRNFLTLNIMNQNTYIPDNVVNRLTDFKINNGYYNIDEIIYHLPTNFKIDFIPKNEHIISEFGDYKITIEHKDNTIKYIREQIIFPNIYNANKYSNLISFLTSIYKSDKSKLVLTNF